MKWKAKYILIASVFYNLAAGLFGPLYAIFVENIGGNILTAGWAWALYTITMGVTLYFMGKLEDKVKKDEIFVVLGFGLISLGMLGYLFIEQPMHLFIVQALLGFGWAFGTPAFDSLYSKNLDKKKVASEWGAYESSVRIVEGIAAFLGAIIASAFGFRALFTVMFILSLIALFIIFNLLNLKKVKLP
ncbi:MAG: MFS transporter [Candidatus Woesearchaeota archaeon]|nr:MAG: MFS transporter [Candidatus Woesearchaeota archaeon]